MLTNEMQDVAEKMTLDRTIAGKIEIGFATRVIMSF